MPFSSLHLSEKPVCRSTVSSRKEATATRGGGGAAGRRNTAQQRRAVVVREWRCEHSCPSRLLANTTTAHLSSSQKCEVTTVTRVTSFLYSALWVQSRKAELRGRPGRVRITYYKLRITVLI